jgi:hypothetical protein
MTMVWVNDAQRPPKQRTTTVMIAEREVLGTAVAAGGSRAEVTVILRFRWSDPDPGDVGGHGGNGSQRR